MANFLGGKEDKITFWNTDLQHWRELDDVPMSSRKHPDNWISISVGTLYPRGHISREGAPPSVNIFKPLPHYVGILVGTTAEKVNLCIHRIFHTRWEYSAKPKGERRNYCTPTSFGGWVYEWIITFFSHESKSSSSGAVHLHTDRWVHLLV